MWHYYKWDIQTYSGCYFKIDKHNKLQKNIVRIISHKNQQGRQAPSIFAQWDINDDKRVNIRDSANLWIAPCWDSTFNYFDISER